MPFPWKHVGQVKIRHEGSVHGSNDEPVKAFGVLDERGRELWGEFRLAWHDDETHFGIEVISFGLFDVHNLGNPHATARAEFREQDAERLREYIGQFLADMSAFPMRSLADSFDGNVSFRPGWMRTSA